MLTDWITTMDLKILDWIQNTVRCDGLDHFFAAFTALGNKGLLFILIGIVLLCIPRYRKWGVCVLSALLLGLIFGNALIKNIVGRARPYDLVQDIQLVIDQLNDYSFPSGHTMAAFETFMVIRCMPVRRYVKGIAGVFAVGMALSRLYLYVHYPSDVIAGIVLGSLFGIMAVRIVDSIFAERQAKKEEAEK